MVVKIMKMFQTVERSYQDKKTGEDKTIKSKEIIVSDGYHSMLVEIWPRRLTRRIWPRARCAW